MGYGKELGNKKIDICGQLISNAHPSFNHTFHHTMSAASSSGRRKCGGLRRYLRSWPGRDSPLISSIHEGDGASSASRPLSLAQPAGSVAKQNTKPPRRRDRFFNLFRRSAPERPPTQKPFKRSTLEKDMAVLSTTYLMEDHPSLKGLVHAIITLSANCNMKDERVSKHGFASIENEADIFSFD